MARETYKWNPSKGRKTTKVGVIDQSREAVISLISLSLFFLPLQTGQLMIRREFWERERLFDYTAGNSVREFLYGSMCPFSDVNEDTGPILVFLTPRSFLSPTKLNEVLRIIIKEVLSGQFSLAILCLVVFSYSQLRKFQDKTWYRLQGELITASRFSRANEQVPVRYLAVDWKASIGVERRLPRVAYRNTVLLGRLKAFHDPDFNWQSYSTAPASAGLSRRTLHASTWLILPFFRQYRT